MNRDEAKARVKRAAEIVEQKAEEQLVAAETKWPVGTAITFLVIGVFLGLFLRGLLPH